MTVVIHILRQRRIGQNRPTDRFRRQITVFFRWSDNGGTSCGKDCRQSMLQLHNISRFDHMMRIGRKFRGRVDG